VPVERIHDKGRARSLPALLTDGMTTCGEPSQRAVRWRHAFLRARMRRAEACVLHDRAIGCPMRITSTRVLAMALTATAATTAPPPPEVYVAAVVSTRRRSAAGGAAYDFLLKYWTTC
jgi:hypothetical protein